MEIVKHPLCTAVIGAPSDMQDGSCSGLPVAYHIDEYGTWALSFWKPDPAELATLMDGGGIVLHVRAHARQHPVIGMARYTAIVGVTDNTALAANSEGRAPPDMPNEALAQAFEAEVIDLFEGEMDMTRADGGCYASQPTQDMWTGYLLRHFPTHLSRRLIAESDEAAPQGAGCR